MLTEWSRSLSFALQYNPANSNQRADSRPRVSSSVLASYNVCMSQPTTGGTSNHVFSSVCCTISPAPTPEPEFHDSVYNVCLDCNVGTPWACGPNALFLVSNVDPKGWKVKPEVWMLNGSAYQA